MRRLIPVFAAGLALLAGCSGPRVIPEAAPPAPVPAPAPRPTPTPAPPPPPASADWRDWDASPGNWDYREDARGSVALFGRPGEDAELTLRCDRLQRQLYLSRKGAAPGNLPLVIRTTSTTRSLTAQPAGGTPAYMAVQLAVGDPLIDAMGYSRGRFVVEQAPLPVLVVPAWAEILRVAEDCRR